MLGLTFLLVGVAQPQARVKVPDREGTVILAFDVSNSMRADDLKPTRIEAAKAAAKTFVEKQPDNIRIGVVAFNDNAFVTQQPTEDRAAATAAIERLNLAGGTGGGHGTGESRRDQDRVLRERRDHPVIRRREHGRS